MSHDEKLITVSYHDKIMRNGSVMLDNWPWTTLEWMKQDRAESDPLLHVLATCLTNRIQILTCEML